MAQPEIDGVAGGRRQPRRRCRSRPSSTSSLSGQARGPTPVLHRPHACRHLRLDRAIEIRSVGPGRGRGRGKFPWARSSPAAGWRWTTTPRRTPPWCATAAWLAAATNFRCATPASILVICHHALEHLPHLEQTLAEMARVLKPGGRLLYLRTQWLRSVRRRLPLRIRRRRPRQPVPQGRLVPLVEQLPRRPTGGLAEALFVVRLPAQTDGVPRHAAARPLRPSPHHQPASARLVGASPNACSTAARASWTAVAQDLSVYGWAFFFERSPAQPAVQQKVVEQPGYLNVCPYCGTGQPAASALRTGWLTCRCPNCSRDYAWSRPFRNAE